MDILGVDGNQGVAAPSWHWDPEAAGRAMPLSKALQVCYDLRSPKPMLLKKLLDCMAAGDGQRSHLQRLVDGLDEQNAGKPTPTEVRVLPFMFQLFPPLLSLSLIWLSLAPALPPQGFCSLPLQLYLEERHVIDILQDFNSAKLPLEDALACLRPLQPRLYSISSSPLEAPNRVQVSRLLTPDGT